MSQLRGAIQQQSAGYKDNIEEFIGLFFLINYRINPPKSVTFPFFTRPYYAPVAREAPGDGGSAAAGAGGESVAEQ